MKFFRRHEITTPSVKILPTKSSTECVRRFFCGSVQNLVWFGLSQKIHLNQVFKFLENLTWMELKTDLNWLGSIRSRSVFVFENQKRRKLQASQHFPYLSDKFKDSTNITKNPGPATTKKLIKLRTNQTMSI